MNSNISLLRAVSSEFLRRKVRSFAMIIGIISLGFVALSVWLVSKDALWWILIAIVAFWLLLIIGALAGAYFIVRSIRPNLRRSQKKATSNFVDKLERVADNLQTPMFIIFFRVFFDLIRANEKGFIKEIAADSSTLHKDLLELKKLF